MSTVGRLFYVTDIHGQYEQLMCALESVSFSATNGDRLVIGGDLIDRGPHSLETLALVEQTWVTLVLGNHEMMAIKSMDNHFDGPAHVFWRQQGGAWFDELPLNKRMLVLDYLNYIRAHCSHAAEFTRAGLTVGVTHSLKTPGMTWTEYRSLSPFSEEAIAAMGARHVPGEFVVDDPDVDVVIVGHNPIGRAQPVYAAGYLYLGNGAGTPGPVNIVSHDEVISLTPNLKPALRAAHELRN